MKKITLIINNIFLNCIQKWGKITPEKRPKENNNKSEKLIGFWTALARVMDGELWMGRLVYTNPLLLEDDDLEKIYWATEFVRNDLVHFIPQIKVLDVTYLKQCLIVVINSIEFIISESRAISGLTINSHPSINLARYRLSKKSYHNTQALPPRRALI